MPERVAIVGSRTWPTPGDISQYCSSLPPGTVIVSGGATGADTFAEEAAAQAGLKLVRHLPNIPRYGSPAAYYHRNLAIVNDSDRVVAFAAKDVKTKQITAGTQMTIDLARRAGVPVEVIETPVPARVCALIARMRHRYAGIRSAPTPGHAAYRVRSGMDLLAQLMTVRDEFAERLADGWQEIEEATGAEREAMETAWVGVLLPTYETVSGVIDEATAVLASASTVTTPLHRHSLHRPQRQEAVAV